MESGIRGIVYVPKIFAPNAYITDRYDCLFSELGFEVRMANTVREFPDVDVVIAYKAAQHSNANALVDLANLPPKIKLINYVVDLHAPERPSLCRKNMKMLLDRSDLIICPYHSAFMEKWPEYADKYEFFPHFFAPHNRFAGLDFNETPKRKALLSGGTFHSVYPMRSDIERECGANKTIDILRHPGYHTGRGVTRDAYAKMIHEYFSGIATASVYKYVVAKYFEIPATGSLLFGERIDDLDMLGFVPGEHYIPITKEDSIDVINECCANPKKYTEIRKAGMKFVRKNHSINNRIIQLEEMIKEVLG